MIFGEDTLRRKKKTFRKKILVWSIFLLIILIFGINSIITIFHQQRQISALKESIEEVKQKNNALIKEIKALKTDPSRIEDLARQIGMMRPGEKKIKFVPEEENLEELNVDGD
jgi:cell division protein FtsL